MKIDFKLEEKDWKRGIENCKYGPIGEDIFVEMCMKKNGVTGTEVFLEQVLAAPMALRSNLIFATLAQAIPGLSTEQGLKNAMNG